MKAGNVSPGRNSLLKAGTQRPARALKGYGPDWLQPIITDLQQTLYLQGTSRIFIVGDGQG